MKSEQLPEGIPTEDLIRIYASAARSNLSAMNEALDHLGSGSPFPELSTVHRLSHNLKGSSDQFGFQEPAVLAGSIEAFAARALEGGNALPEEDCRLLRQAIENLAEMITLIETDQPLPDPSALSERLRQGRS
jgi:chemotaxis protein histidine kinase CheA